MGLRARPRSLPRASREGLPLLRLHLSAALHVALLTILEGLPINGPRPNLDTIAMVWGRRLLTADRAMS